MLQRSFDGNIILLLYKGFSSVYFSFIGMLRSKTLVLDVEGFRHRKEKFIVKELGVCTEDYLDCVSFLPPTSYSELKTQQKQSFSGLTRNLHGIKWDTGKYPYIYRKQIIQSVRLRNPGAIFYARGKEKVKFLSDLIECSIIDLNSLAWPSISELFYTKLSKSFKGQKHLQRTLCKRKSHIPFQLVNKWGRNWRKWKHPCHLVQQFAPWLRETGIWVFQFPKMKP